VNPCILAAAFFNLQQERGGAKIDAAGRAKLSSADRVLQLLREHGPMRPAEIVRALGQNRDTVYQQLHRLRAAGLVLKRDGQYQLLG
jgi:Mn-dependent DtxR family transcriptional regulator